MDIKKIAKQAHKIAREKGFWDKTPNEGQCLMLCISELSEMLEGHRKGNKGYIAKFEKHFRIVAKLKYTKAELLTSRILLFEKYVKDSIGDELADTFIRMCDYCMGFQVKIDQRFIMFMLDHVKEFKMENLGQELLTISSFITLLDRSCNKKLALAEVFSRLIWLSSQLNIPLEKHIKYKMWYNSTRSKMHGKKY